LFWHRVRATKPPILQSPPALSPIPKKDQRSPRQVRPLSPLAFRLQLSPQLAISCVNMRRRVIDDEHPDQDAGKCPDSRHEEKAILASVGLLPISHLVTGSTRCYVPPKQDVAACPWSFSASQTTEAQRVRGLRTKVGWEIWPFMPEA